MNILYRLLYGCWYVLSLLPMWLHYLISDVLYVVVRYVVRYRRGIVRKNLSTAFPEKSASELKEIERGFYHFFCDYMVESVKLMTMGRENLRRRMQFKGAEQVAECIANGQSCAIYLGHYCNWEWVTTLPLWVPAEAQCGQIYRPLENEAFDRLYLSLRQRFGSECISMRDTLRRIIDLRRKNRPAVIGFISDQIPHWVNMHHWRTFLSHPDTPVFTGTERIARQTGYAVFYLEMQRVKRGYYTGEFKLITKDPASLPEYELTDRYFDLLEATIRRAPQYWLWSHNRWKRTREDFDRWFEVVDGKIRERA